MHEDELPYLGKNSNALKVRKPYTLTKPREKWTEEENQKFLEALKLYGRAWRQIEEHIGTKTTIQIRSHAQKLFGKIHKQSGGGTSTGMATDIHIPPPRPKRKPNHPYPRKAGGKSFMAPMSVRNSDFLSSMRLSCGGSDDVASLVDESPFSPPAIAPFSTPFKQRSECEISEAVTFTIPQPKSLKLFGQSLIVPPAIHQSWEDFYAAAGERGSSFDAQIKSKHDGATTEIVPKPASDLFQNAAKLRSTPNTVAGKHLGNPVNPEKETAFSGRKVLLKQDR